MRFGSVLMMAAAALLASVSAQAQTSYQTSAPSGGYVYTGSQGSGSAAPIYNTNAKPLSIKGKNSPSYSFKGAQPYNFGTTNSKSGPMTVEEADRLRLMRDQQASQYEQELVAKINAQNAAPNGQAGGYNNLTQMLPGQQPQQPPRKKRLVYREDANPLRTPPRLFNPDQ